MKSVIQDRKECYLCKTTLGLHDHHCLNGNGIRPMAEKYGLKVWLCYKCHSRVHENVGEELKLKRIAQAKFEENHDRGEFIRIFKRSYL